MIVILLLIFPFHAAHITEHLLDYFYYYYYVIFIDLFKSILEVLFLTPPHLYFVLLAETTIVEILLTWCHAEWQRVISSKWQQASKTLVLVKDFYSISTSYLFFAENSSKHLIMYFQSSTLIVEIQLK